MEARMKKITIFSLLLLFGLSLAFGQGSFSSFSGVHYTVWSDTDMSDAAKLGVRLDGLFDVFNEYFRYDESLLKAPLTVRKFMFKEDFDNYLIRLIGETKDDFVYLHYPSVERSELVIFDRDDEDEFVISLTHQAFVQFIKTFIPEPPLWLREGFAVFFERSTINEESGLPEYVENQAWLETVKALADRDALFTLRKLMTINQLEARAELETFYPQAWAMVAFFVNSDDKKYNRFIWDAIASLRPDASLEENQDEVYDQFVKWYSPDKAEADFHSFLDSQKTFADLVNDGVSAYGNRELDKASNAFKESLVKNPLSYIPYYYMGLIAYAKNDYANADKNYLRALELGSEEAITSYALGISAFASRRFDEARLYLERAMELNPERYEEKVEELMERMEIGG